MNKILIQLQVPRFSYRLRLARQARRMQSNQVGDGSVRRAAQADLREQAHLIPNQEGGICDSDHQYRPLRCGMLVSNRGSAGAAARVPPPVHQGHVRRHTVARVETPHPQRGAPKPAEARDNRCLHLVPTASLGGSCRSHGPRAVSSQVPHLMGSSSASAWASPVHIRPFVEQDAFARGLSDGVQGVDQAGAGPRLVAGACIRPG